MAESQRQVRDPWVANYLVSDAGYRSRDVVTIPQGPEPLPPGTLLAAGGAPATGADAVAILMYPADPRAGPVQSVATTRDAEVNDAYLLYGESDRDAVNASLAEHGIIVREGVLAESLAYPPSALDTAAAVAAVTAPPQGASPGAPAAAPPSSTLSAPTGRSGGPPPRR